MKCRNCNSEFEGHFCPSCGAKTTQDLNVPVDTNAASGQKNAAEGAQTNKTENSQSNKLTAKDLVKESISGYWSLRLKIIKYIIFAVAFLIAIIAFTNGMQVYGVILAILGVMLTPFFVNKYKPVLLWSLIAAAILTSCLCMLQISDRDGQDTDNEVQNTNNIGAANSKDEAWYKKYNCFMEEDSGEILEIDYLDDGTMAISIDDVYMFTCNGKDYEKTDDNGYAYAPDDEDIPLLFVYYPDDQHCVELMSYDETWVFYPITN